MAELRTFPKESEYIFLVKLEKLWLNSYPTEVPVNFVLYFSRIDGLQLSPHRCLQHLYIYMGKC